jgi:polar amino acid transport system substrate-binding protein
MCKFLKSTLALLLLSYSAWGADPSVLRWSGDTDNGAPYIFYDPQDPKHLVGFEVDIINALAEKMGFRPEFIVNEWDSLIIGFNRGLYDIVANGVVITPERERMAEFSKPYYISFLQLVVRSDEDDITSLNDLSGKRVGGVINYESAALVESVGDVELRQYGSEGSMFSDLAHGRIDAVIIDEVAAKYFASVHAHLKLVGQPLGKPLNYALVFPKGTSQIKIERFNVAIDGLIHDGTLRTILDRWNLWNPLMAEYTGDFSESTTEPTDYEAFVSMERPQNVGFLRRLKMYMSFMPILGEGALMTVEISIFSMLLAIFLGLLLALMRVYGFWPVRILSIAIIEVIRGTPLLIQLLIIFYGLPGIGIRFDPFIAGVVGLGINYSAFEAENYRAGLLSIPKGQMEAAMALGMSHCQALRHVILPQAVRIVIPPVTNDFISLLKDSSLVSMITIVELTYRYNQLAATYYDYLGIGILVAVIYLLLGLPFVRLAKIAERKLAVPHL